MVNSEDVITGIPEESSGFTFKAFLTGAILSFLLSIGAPYGNMAIRGSYMALDFSTPGALFLFFVLVGILNVLLGWISKRLTLNRSELITVYVMLMVASAIPTMGLSEYLLPIITAPFYYATPENNWENLIFPHIHDALVPRGEGVVKYFYEGLPKGQSIPWGAWVRPLLIWSTLLAALYLVMISTMVILRKQWMERERLIYPLVRVPLEMIREDDHPSLIKPFFRNPIMWIGFAIPVIVSSINGIHKYYPHVPGLQLVSTIPIFRRTASLMFRLSFPMIGFSYLINLDIAFSLWFFNILAKIQTGVFRIAGISSTEQLGIYGATSSPIQAHEGMGAMIVLVLFGLWVARDHLKDVFRKAFKGDPNVDDSGEMLSYRAAVFGLIGGLIYMTIWLTWFGLPFWITVLFLFGAFLLFVGLTRIVVEGGVAEGVASTISSTFVVSGVGSSALGPVGMTALAFTYVWSADIRTFVMASCANGLKLSEGLKQRKRPLLWAMALALVISLVASIGMILKLSYTYGGINLNGWFFGGGAMAPFNYIEAKLRTPTAASWTGWLATGIGSGIMILLMLARQRLSWWPLHPIGFPVGAVWIMDQIWFSIFLAWLLKAGILKYGGPKLFRGIRPFFLGLILGQFVIAAVWLFIDGFTGMTDNVVFWI